MFAYLHGRDENTKRPLPRRLQELVAQYPYTTSPDQTPDGLLTRPRFSTRRYDALFVRVDAVYADSDRIPPSRSPVGVFTDALESESKFDDGGHLYFWNQVKAVVASSSDDTDKPLPAILSDDTINLLSLISTDPKEQILLGIPGTAPTLVSPLSPRTETSLSPAANGDGLSIPVHEPTPPPSKFQPPKDWAEFSSAGFGETTISQDFASTLLDKDVEVTEPPIQRKPSKQKQNKTTVAPVEPSLPVPDPKPTPRHPEGPKLILAATEVVQLDEAFIDFWRDAVVDPISNNWPKFVVGELKHPLTPRSTSTSSEDGEKMTPGSPINWIIIEERFRRLPPPTPIIPHETSATTSGLRVPPSPLKRTSSPRPSFGEKKSSSLSATLKRFTLFGSSKDDLTTDDTSSTVGGSGRKDTSGGRKKFGTGKSPMIGEMGETVLSEEPEVLQRVDGSDKTERMEQDGQGRGEVVAITAGAVGGTLLATTAGGDPTKEDTKLPVPPQNGYPTEEKKPEVPVASNPDVLVPNILPPAPESVVSHGETPGPQLALDSTETGLHHAPNVQEPTTELAVPLSGPMVEHLEDKIEDPAADFGVDLDPVPITANDPIDVQEAKEPEVVPKQAFEPAIREPTSTETPGPDSSPLPPSISQPVSEPEESVEKTDIVDVQTL